MSLPRQIHKALHTFAKGCAYVVSRDVVCGSEHAYKLPYGITCADIEKRADVLSAAVGAPVEIRHHKLGAVIIRVVEKDFPARISFDEKHLQSDKLLIGYDRLMEPVYHRLMHLLVGGAAGGGKTVWLRWFLFQLVRMKATIKIADLKGFSFFPFETVPGVEIAKSLEETADMLFAALTELERREQLIISTRNRELIKTFNPYVVVIDEAAQLAPKMNKSNKKALGYAQFCDEAVARLAQKGRETKVILLYCTQKPTADIVNGQVKANVETALAFRVNSHTDSGVILGAQGAEKISVATPGRCIYRAGEFHLLQVPFISEEDSEWEKLLVPFKTEVLQHGQSQRTAPQRRYIEGSIRGADSQHQAAGNVKQQFAAGQESLSHTPRLGAGENGGGPIPRKGKGMAAHGKSKEGLWDIPSTVE